MTRAHAHIAAAGGLVLVLAGCAGNPAQTAAVAPPQAAPAVETPAEPAPAAAVPAEGVVQVALATPPPVPQPKPAADVLFYRFLEEFRPEALAAGIKPATYDRAVTGLSPAARVSELNAAQPEFVRPVWDYVAGAVSDLRVSQGREKLTANDAIFDRIEQAYGVPRQVITAIWGLESGYGRLTGNFNLFQALANLAYDGPRQDFARRQFIAALKIAETEGLDPQTMKGSWAGAFGHTQFIPTTFLEHAVDGDADGKRDLWNSPADALASAGSYLRRSGWQPGESWGDEVRLPAEFPYDQADHEIRKPQSEWAKLGVRTVAGQPLPSTDDPVAIFLPAGARGPAFLVRANFHAIMKYNNATSYALAIGLLSDRLRGREGVLAAWPRDEKPLSREQRIALQEGLTALGFSTGTPDGALGRQTRIALRAFQKSRGLTADGFATLTVLARVEADRARQDQ